MTKQHDNKLWETLTKSGFRFRKETGASVLSDTGIQILECRRTAASRVPSVLMRLF